MSVKKSGIFSPVRDELSIRECLVVRGERIVVPVGLRPEYLARIHLGHAGIEACKRRAKDTVYWPSINEELQNYVKNCKPCIAINHTSKKKI